MPEDITGDDQAQEEIDSQDTGEKTEDVATVDEEGFGSADAIVEGFEVSSDAGEKEKAETVKDDTAKESAKSTPSGQEEKKVEGPTADYLQGRVGQLESHIRDLNIALSQERSKAKELKAEEEGALTDSQILQIMRENKDDPDTQFNAIKYLIRKDTREHGKETLDMAEINRRKQSADSFMFQLSSKFPDVSDPMSPIRQKMDKLKQDMGFENHPMGDVATFALSIMDTLPVYSQKLYEEGKKAALNEKAEEARKASIRKPAGPGKKTVVKDKSGLTSSQIETAKQLGIYGDDGKMKNYARIVGKQNYSEAM